jgi:glyoxylase-like metal-dependent hydrolase (beta-lactamase superfamily II)
VAPADGAQFTWGDLQLQALHTPGHASNHVCWWLAREALLFTGDHLMQGSTVVIDPPDGDMAVYLASLRGLPQRLPAMAWLAPGHGFLMDRPVERIERLLAHRLAREAKVLAALQQVGPCSCAALVAAVYADVAPRLHAVAERSLLAHLRKLQQEGFAEALGDTVWRAMPPA